MCSREELRQLLFELLYRLDQVAFLGARRQFSEESSNLTLKNKNVSAALKMGRDTARFEKILRFHKAYIRYFVFASDPYTEFIVPLGSSSLALFMTNILSRDGPMSSPIGYHTSRTIIEFLQITQNHVVVRLLSHYKQELSKVVKELRMPYTIEVLAQIRRDCFLRHFSTPNALRKLHSEKMAQDAQEYFSKNVPKPMHLQTIQHQNITEEIVFQVPIQGTNISVLQPADMMTMQPFAIAPGQQQEFIQNLDTVTPMLIFTSAPPLTIQLPAAENTVHAPLIEIPASTNIMNENMTMDIGKVDSINSVQSTVTNSSQISGHQLCAGCSKPIQDRYLLKALDMLWHEDCLKCGCCDCRLGEVGSTLYTKGNLMLCKRDYLRLFGNTGMCAACNKVIPAFEMVMRARNNVYHLECFACQQCNHRFCVGDRFYLCENKILCEYDYEERLVFASIGNHPMLKRHANTVAQTPPPPYSKSSPGCLPNGNGPITTNVNGVSPLQQQAMAMDQSPSAHQHQQQSHIQQTKLHHDDHNNNNHGPANGASCGISANQFNATLMKIPHSA